MPFDFRELRAFLAVVDTGSLGRASARINLTQPALSRVIKNLEARLGVPLFDRQSSGMLPTAFAETLEPHARMLLFEMGQAVENVDAMRGLRRGTVRVGAVAAVTRILPLTLSQILSEAPNLHVELLEAADDRLFHALANRSIEVAIAGPVPRMEDIVAIGECDFDDECCVICAADHPLASSKSITIEEVLSEGWIMPGVGATPRKLFEQALKNAGQATPRIVIETSSPTTIVDLVSKTQFLGWIPKPLFSVYEMSNLVKPLPISELHLSRNFYIYRRRHGLLPAAAAKFIQSLPTKPNTEWQDQAFQARR